MDVVFYSLFIHEPTANKELCHIQGCSLYSHKMVSSSTEAYETTHWKNNSNDWLKQNKLTSVLEYSVREETEDVSYNFFNACHILGEKQPAVFKVGHSSRCFSTRKVKIEVREISNTNNYQQPHSSETKTWFVLSSSYHGKILRGWLLLYQPMPLWSRLHLESCKQARCAR